MRRFGWAVLGFLIMFVFLSNALVGIVGERHYNNTINRVLTKKLKERVFAALDHQVHRLEPYGLVVLATVRTPRVISPREVKELEQATTEETGRRTTLVVRSTLAKDMSATGSTGQIQERSLDNRITSDAVTEKERIVRAAEQVFWEELADRPDFNVINIQYGKAARGAVLLGTAEGLRPLKRDEIAYMQRLIRHRTGRDDLSLVTWYIPSRVYDQMGEVLYGWTVCAGGITPDREAFVGKMRNAVPVIFEESYPETLVSGIFPRFVNGNWSVLIKTAGEARLQAGDRRQVEMKLEAAVREPVNVVLMTTDDYCLTKDGPITFQMLIQETLDRMEADAFNQWKDAD